MHAHQRADAKEEGQPRRVAAPSRQPIATAQGRWPIQNDPNADPAAFRAYRIAVEVRDKSGVASRLETVRTISLSERAQ